MNPPDRLTPSARTRLLATADECDARADEIERGAQRLADGAGRGEKKLAEGVQREADHERSKARKFRDRAGRGTDKAGRPAYVGVSDHAVVRYLERFYGLDLDSVRDEILPPGVADVAQRMGDGRYPVTGPLGQHAVTVRGGCVVTVIS